MIEIEEVTIDNEVVDVVKSINDIIGAVKSEVLEEDVKKTLLTNVKELLALLEDSIDVNEANKNDKMSFDDPFEMFRKKEESENKLDSFKQIVDSLSA